MITINYGSPSGLFREIPVTFNGPDGGFGIELDLMSETDRCEFGYPPASSGRSLNGDRSCEHVNIKGSLVYNDPTMRGGTIQYTYGTPKITIPGYSSGIKYFRVRPGTWIASEKPRYPYYWGGYDELTRFQIDCSVTDSRIYIKVSWDMSFDNRNPVFREPNYTRDVWFEAELLSPLPSSSDSNVAVTWKYRCKTPHYAAPSGWTTSTKTFYRYGNSVSGLPDGGDLLKAQIAHYVGLLGGDLPPYPDNFTSGVKVDAVEACRVVKINTLALAVDIKNLRSVSTWARSIPKIKKLSDAARSYLGYKYGAPLTADDVVKLVTSLGKLGRRRKVNGHSVSRSRGVTSAPSTMVPSSSWNRQYNVKLYYDPIDDVGATVFRGLTDYGLFPSRKNLWDFIPYSFTLGWLMNVNDYLDAADAEDYLHTVSISSVVQSSRDSITVPGSAVMAGLSGTMEVVFYSRSVQPTLSLENPSFQISNPSNHLLEGGALILARSKF